MNTLIHSLLLITMDWIGFVLVVYYGFNMARYFFKATTKLTLKEIMMVLSPCYVIFAGFLIACS